MVIFGLSRPLLKFKEFTKILIETPQLPQFMKYLPKMLPTIQSLILVSGQPCILHLTRKVPISIDPDNRSLYETAWHQISLSLVLFTIDSLAPTSRSQRETGIGHLFCNLIVWYMASAVFNALPHPVPKLPLPQPVHCWLPDPWSSSKQIWIERSKMAL